MNVCNIITRVLKSEGGRGGPGKWLCESTRPDVAGFEDRGRGHKPRNVDVPLQARKGKEMGSPVEFPGGSPALTTS